MKTDYTIDLLKKAASLGDDGFNPKRIGVDNNSPTGITAAWAEIVAEDLVAPKYFVTDEHALVITAKGRELAGLEPMKP